MSNSVTKLNLLLSCPGDAYDICYPEVKAAIDKVNEDPQLGNSIYISLKHWSTSSYPQSGGRPQELINTQIVEDADMAIAIFWTRFGSPTDKFASGTEEEIYELIKAKKQVFLYFLEKRVPPSITDSEDYIENRKKIVLFRKKYEGTYHQISDDENIKETIVGHLKLYLSKLTNESEKAPCKLDSFGTDKEILPSDLIKTKNMKIQIDGAIARVEVCKPDGKTVYAEMDTKNNSASHIIAEGFPQEYTIDIPPDFIINKKSHRTIIEKAEYNVDEYRLKFGGYIAALYDMDKKLQDITVKPPAGMSVFVDTTKKKIYFIEKEVSLKFTYIIYFLLFPEFLLFTFSPPRTLPWCPPPAPAIWS